MEVTYEDVIAELKTQIAELSYKNAVISAQLKKAQVALETKNEEKL